MATRVDQTRRHVERLTNDLFPRNVSRALIALVAAWRTRPPSRESTVRPKLLRSRVRALKTNNAIVTWVREQAPLAQMIGVHSCLWRAQLQLYGEETAERAALKIGTRYPLRDAILVGLDDWEAEPLNDSVVLVES